MTNTVPHEVPDSTPIIVGAGQYAEQLAQAARPPFNSPMALASQAARAALIDAGINARADNIDTIAVIRLFADSAPAWRCPFGGSENPPESIAQRIGATPSHRIYSTAGGTQPLQLLTEMFGAIARGEKRLVLLAGAEAIAIQRYAQRNGFEENWTEKFDLPMDTREYHKRFASPEELRSGMSLPAHYYALIENYRAHQLGHDLRAHRQHMARLLAPFSSVAAMNPYARDRHPYSIDDLAGTGQGDYPISLPYSKLLVAQDAVNQAAALLLTSVGVARELEIDPGQWIFLQGYAEATDGYFMQRENPGNSVAMEQVLLNTLARAGAAATEMKYIDIYSCFPCAVEAACEILELPIDGSRPLTVTGGLPFFGGPGNNYSMHALAEMSHGLRHNRERGLVTANGGILSKHAAAVLSNSPASVGSEPMDWSRENGALKPEIPTVAVCKQPRGGSVISYTVIDQREGPDTGIVLAESNTGERFLAQTNDRKNTERMRDTSPIGSTVEVTTDDNRHSFNFGV